MDAWDGAPLDRTYGDRPEEQNQEEERSRLEVRMSVKGPTRLDVSAGVLTRSAWGTPTSSKAGRRSTGETTGRETEAARGRGAANTGSRASETDGQATASGLADTGTGGESGRGARTGVTKSGRGVGGGRAVDGARDDLSSANDSQTESALLFRFDQRGICGTGGVLGLPLDAAEFFCVCKNEVHVLESGGG